MLGLDYQPCVCVYMGEEVRFVRALAYREEGLHTNNKCPTAGITSGPLGLHTLPST